jgi:condensin complex subunit 2
MVCAVAFTVDPLFHQMSAQFDEGGAKGLLLNTLSAFQGCEIVCDSWVAPEKIMKSTNKVHAEFSTFIDMSFMKGETGEHIHDISVSHALMS